MPRGKKHQQRRAPRWGIVLYTAIPSSDGANYIVLDTAFRKDDATERANYLQSSELTIHTLLTLGAHKNGTLGYHSVFPVAICDRHAKEPKAIWVLKNLEGSISPIAKYRLWFEKEDPLSKAYATWEKYEARVHQ